MATNAEVIAKTLADEGVENIFGLPGGENVYLLDACRREGICFTLVGHEASAAFMADVTGQITGRAGVCLATLGPGAMNLVSGVANAYLERSPVLALTAQTSHSLYDSFAHQRLLLDQVFAGITKQSIYVDGADTDLLIKGALNLARSGRPGPVHIALPSDLANSESKSSGGSVGQDSSSSRPYPWVAGESFGPHTFTSPGAGSGPLLERDGDRSKEVTAFEEVLARIREARRPLVVLGVGARPEHAPTIRRFLEVTRCAWVTTPKAKGIVPETHPHFLGIAGGMALETVLNETIEMSDLLIGIGFDPVECKETWFLNQPVVNINRWRTEEGRYHPLEAIGDIGLMVSCLIEEMAPAPWPEDLLSQRQRAVVRAPQESKDGLSPLAALRALRDAMPEETIATTDVGCHKLLTGQFWHTTVPHTFFISHGLSCMGYALPAAIAASLQFPERSAVSIVGDGGMLMMAHNLPLIGCNHMPILTVVFTEGSLSLIRLKQERRGLASCGTEFVPPNFMGFARDCGIAAARASSLEDIKRCADRVVKSREPFLLEVPVGYDEYRDLI